MARIAAWLQDARPELVVSDVSVEVTLLCRLLGVPVASVVQPGDRGDEVHRLGHGVSDLLVAFVPPEARPAVRGMTEEDHRRLLCLGSVSAHAASAAEGTTTSGAEARPTSAVPRSVVVLCGRGGGGLDGDALARARDLTPEWEWTVLGARAETWVPDPLPLLRRADVVVTHAGLGALADVALSRRPAVVLPQARPHDEQVSTAQVLAEDEWPAVVERDPATADWAGLLARAAAQDGAAWSRWHDGESAVRFAKVVREWVAASRSDR